MKRSCLFTLFVLLLVGPLVLGAGTANKTPSRKQGMRGMNNARAPGRDTTKSGSAGGTVRHLGSFPTTKAGSERPNRLPTTTALPNTGIAPVETPLLAPVQVTTASVGAPINLDWVSINHGGAVAVAAGNLKMGVSVGQPVAGYVEGGGLRMGLGFWYGAAAGGGGCICDCHADPACDGVPSILDVVLTVDVAFRGGPAHPDPNALCPYETTDVTCNGVTDIVDAVRLVEVALRGGDAGLQFCDPCGGGGPVAQEVPQGPLLGN